MNKEESSQLFAQTVQSQLNDDQNSGQTQAMQESIIQSLHQENTLLRRNLQERDVELLGHKDEIDLQKQRIEKLESAVRAMLQVQ